MASRLPNEENEDAMRPLLGWDQAMAALQRNLLQQNQQHQSPLSQATAAAIAAGLTPPTSLPNPAVASLWPYNLPGTSGMLQPAAAAAAAASLASLGNPANSYMNHLPNLHNPESLLSFQQNLIFLEQLQQQRQLLASNPHLLMALQAAQASNASVSPQTHTSANNSHHFQHHPHSQQQSQHNLLAHANLQMPISELLQSAHANNSNSNNNNNNNSPKLNGINTTTNTTSTSNTGHNLNGTSSSAGSSFINNNTSLLTTVNSNLASALTNQHQDSLVDQHFRRSLGEDYNQIMSNKIDKINAAK